MWLNESATNVQENYPSFWSLKKKLLSPVNKSNTLKESWEWKIDIFTTQT